MKCLMCEGLVKESKTPGWYTCEACGIEYSRIAMSSQAEGVFIPDEKPLMCSTAFIDYKRRSDGDGKK